MADLNQYIPGLGRGVTAGSSDINPLVVQYISVPLTSAQILAFNSAAVQVIPNPGANFATIVTDFVVDVAGGTAYAAGGTVGLYYGGTNTFIAGSISTQFTSTTGSTVYLSGPTSALAVVTGTAVVVGMAGTTAFTTGNETATVQVWYATIPTGH